jgi:membrane complex biogenesis BtpA family protein
MQRRLPYTLIGVVHLPPMPGYVGSPGLQAVIDFAVQETMTLQNAGFDSVLIENEGDRPHPLKVSQTYLEDFCRVIQAVRTSSKLQVGLEILYDMLSTVRAGIESNADFIRLDVFTDDTETRWGVVKACVKEVQGEKERYPSTFPALFVDVHVKHGINLTSRTLAESSQIAVASGADSLIVTGSVTGVPPTTEDCEIMGEHAAKVPIYIGSGFSSENASQFIPYTAGAIVGSSIQSNGRLDPEKCLRLADCVAGFDMVSHG